MQLKIPSFDILATISLNYRNNSWGKREKLTKRRKYWEEKEEKKKKEKNSHCDDAGCGCCCFWRFMFDCFAFRIGTLI